MTLRQFARAVVMPARRPLTKTEFFCAAVPRPWMWPVLGIAFAVGVYQGYTGKRRAA